MAEKEKEAKKETKKEEKKEAKKEVKKEAKKEVKKEAKKEIKKELKKEEEKQCKAVGRRKEASARVTITRGSGVIKVNKRDFKDYFPRETIRMVIEQPIKTCGLLGRIDIVAGIKGSGVNGQAGALRHGIARALLLYDERFKDRLKKGGYLTRDPRMKERKKYGQEGARRKFQWVKR